MAISFDAASTGSWSSGTSLTVSHTVTGANTILIVGVQSVKVPATGDLVTGVTYNTVAMTLLTKVKPDPGDDFFEVYFFYLIAPSTGANNIVVSYSSAPSGSDMVAASYTGVSQTGYPDAQSSGVGAAGGTITGTVTTVADNAWPVIVAWADNNGNGAGAGTTIRQNSGNSRVSIADSNGPKTPAGSTSLNITTTGATFTGYIIASMAPAGGGGGGTTRDARLLALLGVG